uniref:EF-hand domain-containing protein n=1 Tax=Branchiostoma floridae TaxID=7739 RepID=C3ZW62_BRAFL|eukprot:XP_002587182.1 hypothetical protein BRAFLDRAFT_102067 [Branchiostoma floridae]
MELNTFQKQKIKFTFDFFLDYNKDGAIQWDDFQEMIKRYKDVNKGSLSDADYKLMLASLEDEWKDLKALAHANEDHPVSFDAYLAMWEKTLATCKSVSDLPTWCQKMIPILFKGMDVSGDGIVDLEEFGNYCKNFQLDCEDVPAVYDVITDAVKDVSIAASYGVVFAFISVLTRQVTTSGVTALQVVFIQEGSALLLTLGLVLLYKTDLRPASLRLASLGTVGTSRCRRMVALITMFVVVETEFSWVFRERALYCRNCSGGGRPLGKYCCEELHGTCGPVINEGEQMKLESVCENCEDQSVTLSAFFTLLYGVQYGRRKAEAWLFAFLVSFLTDIIIVQPLKIVLIVIFVRLISKTPKTGILQTRSPHASALIHSLREM